MMVHKMNAKRIKVKRTTSRTIFLKALIVRLVLLTVIFVFTPKFSVGFLSDSYLANDDVRFETGGMYYANNAKSIIDFPTFKQAYGNLGDWVGYKTGNLLNTQALWYWIICIILYLTKNVVFLRLFNIIISSLSCVLLYRFVNEIYNKKIASIATKMLMYLPYQVVFSCFAYRDHLIMLLTIYLVYKSAVYQKEGVFKKKSEWIIFIIAMILLLMLRSGLPIILIALCFNIMFFDRLRKSRVQMHHLALIIGGLIVAVVLFYRMGGDIVFKAGVYILRRSFNNSGALTLLNINGIKDIYKLPFAYLFSVIMPIGLGGTIDSWADIIGYLNVLMVFVASGSFIFMFMNKRNQVLYWSCMAYYLVCIIASLGIFRHYYSLLPFIYLSYAEFLCDASFNRKLASFSLGILYAMALIVYYLR